MGRQVLWWPVAWPRYKAEGRSSLFALGEYLCWAGELLPSKIFISDVEKSRKSMQNLLLSLMCSKLSAKCRGEVEPAVI